MKIPRKNPNKAIDDTLKQKAAKFIFIGICDRIFIEQGKANPVMVKGAHAMLTNKKANKLFIVPFSELTEIDSSIQDKKAEEIYQMWHQFDPDDKDFAIQWPQEKARPVGVGHSIYYVSDKALREYDGKGKMNMYHHDFDPGKRPASVKGNILIISNLDINERGILN